MYIYDRLDVLDARDGYYGVSPLSYVVLNCAR